VSGKSIGVPESYSPTPSAKILPGEEDLLFEVQWTFVKIGTIRIKARPDLTADAYVDSYEGLPYVDLHSIQSTRMDSTLCSYASRSMEKGEREWVGLHYEYDLPRKRVFVEEVAMKDSLSLPFRRTMKDTIALPSTALVDGLSIAYYPRRFVHGSTAVQIPTILYGKLGATSFYFPGERTTVDLDAVDYPVRAVEIEGATTVEGVFGMTGDFKGWFSDDEAAVPLKGRLKVLLGWVNVELKEWHRKGWAPPR
jgi:hypothetical protein